MSNSDPVDAEIALLSATQNLVSVLKDFGLTRKQAWDYIRNLDVDESTTPIRRAHFDMVWP